MRHLVIILIIAVLMDSTNGDFTSGDSPNCPDENAAPYHIIQPSTDDYIRIVYPVADDITVVTLSCSLNITIPTGMTVTWLRKDKVPLTQTQFEPPTNTATLMVGTRANDRLSVFQCVFNNTAGCTVRRNITVLVVGIAQPQEDPYTITVVESASPVHLMCSLNIEISSNVTVTWLHNGTVVMATPTQVNNTNYNATTQTTAGNTATLVIEDPQPSDAGVYQCVFNYTYYQWIEDKSIILELSVSATTSITSVTTMSISSSADTFIATTSSLTTTSTPSTGTFTTGITILGATITPSVTATATDVTSSSSGVNPGVIVAPIIIIIIIALVVAGLIITYYWWRSKKPINNNIYDEAVKLNAESPYYSTVKPEEKGTFDGTHVTKHDTHVNKQPSIMYAVPDKLKKERSGKSAELQRSSDDFSHKPQHSSEMSRQSQKQNQSLIAPNYEQDMELDIYAAPGLPERTEASTIFDSTDEDNPIYSEAINPTVIIDKISYDYSSDNDSLCPYASIYADPLPLTKSEGPPIVSSENIEQLHQLGTGQFGEVILANTVGLSHQYLGIGDSNDSIISMKVAVKTLKSSPTEDVQKAFEKEIKFMSRLKDDNVIRLLGICTTGTPFIMMEYMENGDLNNYLQQFDFTTKTESPPAADEITLNTLVYMSCQIASGMKYLSSHKFIHRDLAARNILVGVDFTVKIADFGMSQNLYSAYYYKIGGRICLPIRWMAYECFFGKFSVKTDVWAFGIVLWEIFTLCRCQPFHELSDQEMIQDAIKGANRKIPYQTDICPNDIYKIMKSCFHHEPSERAGFGVLCDQLNECYSKFNK